MAVVVREIAGSESGTEGVDVAEATIQMVTKSTNRAEQRNMVTCRTAVFNYLAAMYPGGYVVEAGYPLRFESLERSFDDDSERWLWAAKYSYRPPEATLRWGFNTSGGSVRVTHSKNTTRYPGTGPNFQGAIAVQSGGEPQGTDIVIPALKLTATYRWPKNTVTTTYVNALASLSGCVNSAAVDVYAAGELLFLGASGEITPGLPTEIVYEFAASANATGLTIGGISSIAKKGHEYLWVLWEDDEDTTAKRLVKKPLCVYVERVYTEASFATLGIF